MRFEEIRLLFMTKDCAYSSAELSLEVRFVGMADQNIFIESTEVIRVFLVLVFGVARTGQFP